MSLYADSHNPDREIQRIRIKLQTRAYEAAGGKIKQLPAGASTHQEKSLRQRSRESFAKAQLERSDS